MPDSLPTRVVDHDVAAGLLTRCQVCGSEHLREIINLGHQPLCDALLTAEQLHEPEVTYPLGLMQCEECTLAQLPYVVPGDKVYPADYPYKAGISWPVVKAHKEMAAQLVGRFGVGHVVDIGCNDGTLLKCFAEFGCQSTGVEPTEIAACAGAAGIPTYHEPFKQITAEAIRDIDGKAKFITFTNVFAHMADLGEVMRGIVALLADDGVLVIENHYLLDVMERNQFDTIYHEHIRTYSLKSLVTLFAQYGMEVSDVERVPRYGGNIRVYVSRQGVRPVSTSVGELLALEQEKGLGDARQWAKFRDSVYDARDIFMQHLYRWRGGVAGCSAPGRATTLLNFFGVTPDLLPWTGEIDGSLKIGRHIPGCHVPIVSNARLVNEQPERVVLLAWHYGKEIATRLRREGLRSRLVMPLPLFAEIDS